MSKDIQDIDNQINEILNGTRDIPQFNQPEHAGVCSAGPLLIGAIIVCNNTRESLVASSNATGSEEQIPNWQIDEELEQKSVSSILEHTATDRKVYRTQFYNLDVRKSGVQGIIYTQGVGSGMTRLRDEHNRQEGVQPVDVFKWRVEPS